MNRNIEIKARLRHPRSFVAVAEEICNTRDKIKQVDTYFNCVQDFLKLRQESNGRAELICYRRRPVARPKASYYRRTAIENPNRVLEMLSTQFGIRGVVRKTRTVFLFRQMRVHYDRVEGLGQFMELEVVLAPTHTTNRGLELCAYTMAVLGIDQQDLLSESYIDLVEHTAPDIGQTGNKHRNYTNGK